MIPLSSPVRLQTQLTRTLFMLALLAVLLLLPFRLDRQAALVTSLVGLACLAVFATALGSNLWRSLRKALPDSTAGRALSSPGDGLFFIVALVRRVGLAPLGLVFLIAWALIYMLIWALSPESCPSCAFYGAKGPIAVSEFFYLSVNLAVANPPPTIYPISALAKAAGSLEVVSGLAVITLSAGAFFGVNRQK